MASLPVDVLWIARYDYGPGWSLPLHNHDFLQMILFLDGTGTLTLSDQVFPIRGGELFLIRSGEMHGLRAESLVRTLDVKFRVEPGALFDALGTAAPMLEWHEPSLAARLERIRSEGEQKPPFYRELCSVLLTEILYLYLRQDLRPNLSDDAAIDAVLPNDHLLERAVACIRTKFQTQLTVRDIARAAGCTDRTLRLHFQNVIHMRPLAYLQRYRIAQSKLLIQHSDYSLKEIAEQVGFQTVHHFTRLFTALEGRSPAVWRREYQEGIRRDVYINPAFENRIFTVGDARE
jgi:AraC family L-rhamnose operon transcriptional activator RhaR